MKTIVVYYSNKGSNRYLAEMIANRLACDIEEIKPRVNIFLLFLMKINFGNTPLKHSIKSYDRVILCGPIWMGRLIPPLRSFIFTYFSEISKLVFVTSCGSSFAKKDDKFGYGFVFKKVESILKGKCEFCQAFPVGLVLPDEMKEDTAAFMNTQLNDANFKGEIQAEFDTFIAKVTNDIR